jgi:hypothetical protein
MQTHSSNTKHLHIMTYGKLVVLPGAAGLPGCCRGAAGCYRVLPGAAGCCRVPALTSSQLVSAAGCCRVYYRVLPGCRVVAGRCRVLAGLPGAAGLPGCCRVVAGLGCRVAAARAQKYIKYTIDIVYKERERRMSRLARVLVSRRAARHL